MSILRDITFHVARALGAFAMAQRITGNRLRILCYHGFSVGDEYQVQPHMFMRASTFERRMQIMVRRKIPVISLTEAIEKLEAGRIHGAEAVITLDDGWASTLTIGAPILERHGFPASIYVTTEHLSAGTEVFNVALCYMILRSGQQRLRLAGLHPKLDGTHDLRMDPYGSLISLISAAEEAFPRLADRQRALPAIAEALGMNIEDVLRDRRFRLLTRAEMQELVARGFDIELHTHTHRLPDREFELMAEEVEKNRSELEALLGKRPSHFCFPSGRYSPKHPEWLQRLGVVSATTCDPGLNPPGAPRMLLKRYLDNDEATDIAFEAEICGFRELLRLARAALGRLGATQPKAEVATGS